MRRGEVLGLKWENVDLREGVPTSRSTDTKTQEEREIPLDENFANLFRRIPKVLGNPYVFNFRGRRIKDPRTAFLKACVRANITNFHFHDLRNYAITNFRKSGLSDTTIMSISGHKTYAVFWKYDRIDREDRQNALAKVRRFKELKDTYRTPEVSVVFNQRMVLKNDGAVRV
jgi:integrase